MEHRSPLSAQTYELGLRPIESRQQNAPHPPSKKILTQIESVTTVLFHNFA